MTYCKKHNVSLKQQLSQAGQDEAFIWQKIVQLKPDSRLLKPGSWLGETGRKNVPPPYKQYAIKNYRNICMSGSQASSRPGKTSRPASHINRPLLLTYVLWSLDITYPAKYERGPRSSGSISCLLVVELLSVVVPVRLIS